MFHRHDAVQKLIQDQSDYKIELSEDSKNRFQSWLAHDLPASDPLIPLEEQSRCSLEIEKIKGRNTRKYWHVSVTRKDNGYWESNSYPL